MPRIVVHEKALAHLSRGLYRSPASALRELVSNAWDANALIVRIGTNYPGFFHLSVDDNGKGFTRDQFQHLMEGGIGNSDKRTTVTTLTRGRPMIGRLGIGMLGLAQMCGSFTVISRPLDGKGFRAKVQLYDLLKHKLDHDNADVVKVSDTTTATDDYQLVQEVDVGTYEFEKFEPSAYRYGTRIVSKDLHPTFVRSFQQSLKFEDFKEPPQDWRKAIRIVSRTHSLQQLGDYWRLLWELAASCPLPYLDKTALPDDLIAEEHIRLENYGFKVVVDGIELRKPVYLKDNPGGYTTHRIDDCCRKVYGKDLRFHGYLIVQEGAQLKPDELRGIMIRIKNVGIGYYDPSLLDYRFNEGPRSRWVTGEIFVEEGLEDALNIDRDSFNRFHPEFRALQETVHELLHRKIFPSVYKNIDRRSKTRMNSRRTQRTKHFTDVVSSAISGPVKVKQQRETAEGAASPRATVVRKADQVEVLLPAPQSLRTKKSYQELAGTILGIFEVALQEKSSDRQRSVFTQLLMNLLKKW